MRQELLDAAFRVLLNHADELDNGEDPVDILYKEAKTPRIAARKILGELCGQDKIGLLKNGEEIVAAFINRGLEEKKRAAPFRANAVVLADVENIRLARELPHHIFPGEAINDQLKRTGYLTRDRFAFISTKRLHTNPPSITPAEIITQATTLLQHGFIPVICPYIDEKSPSPDDEMLMRFARFCHGHPDIETFIVLSGDKDFSKVKQETEANGHDFRVFAPSSNIGRDWLRRSGATKLNLNEQETRAYNFLEGYLAAINKNGELLTATNDDEETALLFLDHVVSAVKRTRKSDFVRFSNVIWTNLPNPLQRLYNKEFLNRIVHLLASSTDIINKTPSYTKNGQPGTLFSYNTESKILWVFTGDEKEA